MRKMYAALPVVLALSFFVACKKGDTGPAGPAGPTGATGATGADGTANVIYSDWLDVTFETDPEDTTGTYNATIPASSLTEDMLNTGELKAYINLNTPDDPAVFPLPYLLNGYIITLAFAVDTIYLAANFDASSFVDNGDKILQYRYVLIPGGQQAYKGVDFNNYLEVKEKFKLKD